VTPNFHLTAKFLLPIEIEKTEYVRNSQKNKENKWSFCVKCFSISLLDIPAAVTVILKMAF